MIYSFIPLIRVIPRKWSQQDDWNAHNNPLIIEIYQDLGTDESWAGVLAQERYEYGFKWWFWWALWIPAIFMEKHIESMGHAIEAHVAWTYEGRNLAEYELREAGSLLGYKAFKGTSDEVRLKSLTDKRAAAARWCRSHDKFIRRAVAYSKGLA